MDVTELLSSLNDAQRDAVAAPPESLLVLAGAGSGKTRVLVHRIAWLLATENISPHRILAVTFTNKAAAEMRGRIEMLLKQPAQGMWVGTFHGLAHRLLRTHWQEANLPENFQILDSEDQIRLIKRVIKNLSLDETEWPAKQAQIFINSQKEEGIRPQHMEPRHDRFWRTQQHIYQQYEEACHRGGLVDFAEILLRAHELWLNRPSVLKHYQDRFKYILVDEFQDTNRIQYAWLRVLAGNNIPMMAVGDDDQSIYGWRGARVENLQKFLKDFVGSRVVKLEQNYRSTSTILKAANSLISNNDGRLGKQLWTEGREGEPIALYAGFNEQDEARFIVERIAQWVAHGNKRSETAILYRSNAQSRALEEALVRAGMPYRIYGGVRFYERMEIKNAVAYLRLLANRDDDAAFERVVNTPTRGIGEKTLDTVRLTAREQQISLWQASIKLIAQTILAARAASTLQAFIDLINTLDADTQSAELHVRTDHVIQASGLITFYKNEKGEKGQTRVENLQELVSDTKRFALDNPDENKAAQLNAFLAQAALDAGEAQADEFEDSVQLMTLHSAKGLEFPMVFLAGCEEGLFPNAKTLDEPGRLEEERRLCYVGITRAMQKLYITFAETRRLYGNETFNAPSRFIKEIPVSLLEEVRVQSTTHRPSVGKPIPKTYVKEEIPATGLQLGQRVKHETFGEGTVINYEGQGPQARVQIKFSKQGTKWLVLSYAKLETV